MATITLKIDEKSKAGQAFMAFIKHFVINNDQAVEVVEIPNTETLKAMANVEAGKGLTKTKSHADLMAKLNS